MNYYHFSRVACCTYINHLLPFIFCTSTLRVYFTLLILYSLFSHAFVIFAIAIAITYLLGIGPSVEAKARTSRNHSQGLRAKSQKVCSG